MLHEDPVLSNAIRRVHDLAEAIVGDITPQDNVSSKDKHAMERQAMHDMAHKMLGSTPESLEIQALWEEYETAETPEALAVKDIDKFEVCFVLQDP